MSFMTECFKSVINSDTFVAQIVGFIPLILALFVFVHNNRKKIIFFKFCTDFLWAIHFFMLGELSGAIVNVINTARNLIFSQKGKKWASNKMMPVIFCILISVCTLITDDSFKSIFPLLGSCLATIGFWQNTPEKIRLFNFLGIFLWLIYGFLTISISTIISNIISLISIILPTAFKKIKKKN